MCGKSFFVRHALWRKISICRSEDLIKMRMFMRLAQFIRTHPDEIESGWEKFAKAISTFAPDLSASSLRDHLREILVAIADDMATPQSQEEQSQKSEGKQIRGGALDHISAHMRV